MQLPETQVHAQPAHQQPRYERHCIDEQTTVWECHGDTEEETQQQLAKRDTAIPCAATKLECSIEFYWSTAMRWVVIALLLAIMVSLGSGLFSLVKDKSNSDRTATALTWRIGLSLLLFFLIVLIYRMGWVSGHLLP
jgi:hypothetical protein